MVCGRTRIETPRRGPGGGRKEVARSDVGIDGVVRVESPVVPDSLSRPKAPHQKLLQFKPPLPSPRKPTRFFVM
jgi:hypothetical protein